LFRVSGVWTLGTGGAEGTISRSGPVPQPDAAFAEIEIAAERFTATASLRPPYDPGGERVRS